MTNDETRMTMPVPGAAQRENARESAPGGTEESSSSLVLDPESLRSEDEDEHEGRGRPEAIRTLWPS
jgi:hypothetical protein